MTRYRDRLNAGEFKPKPKPAKTKQDTTASAPAPDASWTDRAKQTDERKP